MMFRKIKYISILFLFAITAFAQSVDVGTAESVAKNWIEQNKNYFGDVKIDETFAIASTRKNYETIAYFVTLNPKGFILVASDQRIKPVTAFSNEKKVNFQKSENDLFFCIIKDDIEIKVSALKSGKYNDEAAIKNRKMWKMLLNNNLEKSPNEIIGPFVESDWGQGNVNGEPLFNIYTPNNWPAGCVATAMAQALNYYKWPLRGSGSHSYFDDNTGTHSADFENTNYDWPNTLDKYVDVFSSQDEKNAAALLTYHSCVSVDMDFDFAGSTAETADAPRAFKNYFRTSAEYFSVSADGFFDMLKEDVIHLRPSILSIKAANGAGHAAVVDGYFETNEYFHLNPGWYGDFTGWYDISDSWNMAGYTIVVGATRNVLPLPMFLQAENVDSLSKKLLWTSSKKKPAEKFELQEAETYGGAWETLSDNLTDTSFVVTKENPGTYYYRICTMIDGEWGEFSLPEKIVFGFNPVVRFQVNMSRYSEPFDSVGVRGNIPPLSGSENGKAFVADDSIYSLDIEFDNSRIGETVLYRFSAAYGGSYSIETENREYELTSDSLQILPPVYFNDFPSGINEEPLPKTLELKQNYPNPFGKGSLSGENATTVEFVLSRSEFVSFTLYNSLGELVEEISVGKPMNAGVHRFTIDFSKRSFSTGVYYLNLKTERNISSIKLLYLK